MEEMKKEIRSFYSEYIKVPFENNEIRNKLKEDIFSKILKNNLLYKYISFTSDTSLNDKKLTAIRENKLWFAAHHVLRNNDSTEFKVLINATAVANSIRKSIPEVLFIMETIRELNDVCCLSDQLDKYMWQYYANNHSGCCCVFGIEKYEMLWPVIYCNKKEIDFTRDLIRSIKNLNLNNISSNKIAFISPVLKDEIKYGREHEVRLLCSDIYDNESDALGGRIMGRKKEALGYTGTYYSYEKCGLVLKKIIIGKNVAKSIVSKIQDLELNVSIETE